MASEDRKFTGWFFGVATAVLLLAIGGASTLLWNLNGSVIALTERLAMFTGRIDLLDSRVAAASSQRYTSDDAAKDRAAILTLISNEQERNNAQANQLATFSERITRMEERLRVKDGAP